MKRKYRYMKRDFAVLPVKLEHLTIYLNFFEDRVEATNTLEMTANRATKEIALDASELKIISVRLCSGPEDRGRDARFTYNRARSRLTVRLEKPAAKGDRICIRTHTHCFPSDTNLEGIYRDTTPKGAPQQYMSQCEMWGFQRIMPVIDDPRAKCTMRTTMEADARYTHIISNGNIDRKANPSGKPEPKPGDSKRKVITYCNDIPMSPYLFIAAAGTWDELKDSVTYDNGRKIILEYLVPKGRKGDAKTPMEILKKSILWIKEKQDYEYKRDVYRTITMDKSDAGGMENVGNTTIITDAALIDEHTLDGSLMYAYKVIVHEFEHNQCGSETTMETPFDMWLNEAYTVDVERQFTQEHFNPAMLRVGQVDSLRDPVLGTLAMEDAGYTGRIVREGFNHPRELIDGVTYEKAAEVIRMLRLIIGKEAFRKGKTAYFSRYRNSNANNDQFFGCFEEAYGKSLRAFKEGWLFRIGYPVVSAKTAYDGGKGEFSIIFRQEQKGKPFHIPIDLALVDSGGRDIPGTSQIFHFCKKRAGLTIRNVKERPAFASLNRDYSFYGTFRQDLTRDEMIRQSLSDPNHFNRLDAMNRLTDIQRIRLINDPEAAIDRWWIELYGRILDSSVLSSSLKSNMLFIDEISYDRRYLTWYQERVSAREALMKAVNRAYRDRLVSLFNSTETYRRGPLEKGIEDRMLKSILLSLIAIDDSPESHDIILKHYRKATTPTDRFSALVSLNRSSSPERRRIIEEAYRKWSSNLSGYSNYLRIVSSGTKTDVWEMIEKEKKRKTMDMKQPTYARSLLMPMIFNTRMVWTRAGLEWARNNIIEMSEISMPLASRMLNLFQLVRKMRPEQRKVVSGHLREIIRKCPSSHVIREQARGYLKTGRK